MIHSGSYDAETDRRNVFKAAYFLKGSWNKAASEMGIPKRDLITNGFFAKDRQRIKYF